MKLNSKRMVKGLARLTASAAVISMVATPAMAQSRDKNRDRQRVESPNSFPQAERNYDAMFSGRPAVQRVRVPGGLFISKPMNDLAPQSLLAKHIEIDIRSEVPTLSDLQMLLEIEGINITIDYNSLYEAAQVSSEVGSFTAASKYQQVANSVKGGTGVQQNGFGRGFGNNGFGNSGFGNNSGGGFGGSDANITVEGASGNGSTGGSRSVNVSNNTNISQGVTPQRNEVGIRGNPDGSAEIYATRNDQANRPNFYNRILPFRYFNGTVGELMRKLENSGNIAVWYQNGIVIGGMRRYSVSLLQQQDIIQSVVNELQSLGAGQVVGSVGAGQVFYSAPPRTNNEIIEPYLRRISGNLSEVTLQVALVTVAMSRSDERGFDWSALNFGLGADVTGSGSDSGVDSGDVVTSQNGVFTINSNNFSANLGDIFGIDRVVSIAGAINFLSRMGDTSVAQNVELRTLSGSPVILRSGEDIPYVSGVGSNFVGGGFGGGVAQNTQTQRLGTGLTLNVDPRYDHTSGIVTMDIGLKLVDLVEFVQLDAGDQIGTLTQPRTREQGVNSILRVPAGQTTILGGIRRELNADQRNGPFGLFGIGSRQKQHEVFWLFAVVRPVVTVYENADSPVAPRSILDTRTTINPYDEGSYGVSGRPGPAIAAPNDPTTNNQGGVPTYYGQGGTTPANRMPAGVTTAAPPAPRGVVVPGASTPPEVNPYIPEGAVLRDPGAAGSNYEERAPLRRAEPVSGAPVQPAYPVPAPDQDAGRATATATPIPDAGTMPNGAAVPVVEGQPVAVSTPEAGNTSTIVTVDPTPQPEPRRSFIRPMTQGEKED